MSSSARSRAVSGVVLVVLVVLIAWLFYERDPPLTGADRARESFETEHVDLATSTTPQTLSRKKRRAANRDPDSLARPVVNQSGENSALPSESPGSITPTDVGAVRVLVTNSANRALHGASVRVKWPLDQRDRGTWIYEVDPSTHWERRGVTDEAGVVEWTDLPVGAVKLIIEKPGHSTEEIPSVRVSASEVNQVEVSLSPGVAVSGVVRDGATDAPIAGAEILAKSPSGWSSTPWRGRITATSDREGRFLLDGLPPRTELSFSTSARGFASSRTTQWTGHLQAPPVSMSVAMARATVIKGTVRHDGIPRSGVRVYARSGVAADLENEQRSVPWPLWGLADAAAETETTADGTFRLEGLEMGRSQLIYAVGSSPSARAHAVVVATTDSPDSSLVLDLVPFPQIRARFRLADGTRLKTDARTTFLDGHGAYRTGPAKDGWEIIAPQVDGVAPGRRTVRVEIPGFRTIVFTVVAPATGTVDHEVTVIRGQVLTGRLVDAQGVPIAAAELAAVPLWSGVLERRTRKELETPWRSVETDESGRFAIHGLYERPYRIERRHYDKRPEVLGVFTPPKRDLHLVPPAPGVIEITVSAPGSKIRPRVVGVAFVPAGDLFMNWLPHNVEWPVDGVIRIDDAPAMPLRFRVTSDELVAVPAEFEVDVQPGTVNRVAVAFKAGVTLQGRVSTPSGEPLSDVLVEVELPNGDVRPVRRRIGTDAMGAFTLDGLAPGTVTLRLQARGRAMRRETVHVRDGMPLLSLTLALGKSVQVAIWTKSKLLARECSLRVRGTEHKDDPSRSISWSRLTRGWARVTLPLGKYVAEAQHAEIGVGRVEFEIKEDSNEQVDLWLDWSMDERRR